MAPLRRYLRITKHSILEVRIYLDNPSDLHRWLIHPQHPVLPDVLAAVKPYVLPKLREENARAGKKTITASGVPKPKGKKGVRDIVVTDSFEVSIFLTELSTPHAVLLRTRDFTGKGNADGQSGTQNLPVEIREESDDDEDVQLIRQESNVSGVKAEDMTSPQPAESQPGDHAYDAQSISSNEDAPIAGDEDEKKKLGLKTNYEGFNIYGRILCLVVKRKGQLGVSVRQRATVATTGNSQNTTEESIAEMVQRTATSAGQRDEGIIEGWMRSTQVGNDNDGIAGANLDADDDDGEVRPAD